MEDFPKKQAALVTGAGRGIGRACALALAGQGYRVALVSRTRTELEATAEQIRAAGGEALVLPADISRENDVAVAFAEVRKLWGGVDVLVNNAGVFLRAELVEHSLAQWESVFGVNVTGTFLCTRELFRGCKMSGAKASVINISSISGMQRTSKFPGTSAYIASKFAVVGMTEAFALEGKPMGIRVNAIAPGSVDTEMLRESAPHLHPDLTPEDLAKTVCYLADSSRSSHLNGATIEMFSAS